MKNLFDISNDEKEKILNKHKTATKEFYVKKDETKKGLQKPEIKEKKSS